MFFRIVFCMLLISGLTANAAEPGVRLQLVGENGERTQRIDRRIALHVPIDTPPTAALPAGPFAATWTGHLSLPLRDRITFTFEGNGQFELFLNDRQVLNVRGDADARTSEAIRLSRGANVLRAEYRSPAEGPATVRLLWAGTEFSAEPIPAIALSHDENSPIPLARVRRWLGEGRCFRCHGTNEPLSIEFTMDAPALVFPGDRFRGAWMAAWIADPTALRADAQMPRLLHGATADQEARDIAEYLASLRTGEPQAINRDAAIVQRGGQLYAQLGCVGCHRLAGQSDEHADRPRLSLSHVAAKFFDHALRDFLQAPRAYYAHSGMPDFRLTADEASAIAAFLLSTAEPVRDEPMTGDLQAGRTLVAERGCVLCHAGLPVANAMNAPSLETLRAGAWDSGCMGDTPSPKAPWFGLDAEQRQHLRSLDKSTAALQRFNATEYAIERIESLRCNACHRTEDRVDQWTKLAEQVVHLLPAAVEAAPGGEPKELDQTRPELTHAGEKLQHSTLLVMLSGTSDRPARPWLAARMPGFGLYARPLADGLAMMHGFAPEDEPPTEIDPALAAIGERLIHKPQGFGCSDCHAIGDAPARNPFEAEGVNLALSVQRLRSGYAMRWMLNPLRIDPATKMPRYADSRGQTALLDILEGDATQQFQAITDFLRSRNDSP